MPVCTSFVPPEVERSAFHLDVYDVHDNVPWASFKDMSEKFGYVLDDCQSEPCDTVNVRAAMIPPSSGKGGGREHSPNSVQHQYLIYLPPLPRPLRKISSVLAQCLPRQWIHDV